MPNRAEVHGPPHDAGRHTASLANALLRAAAQAPDHGVVIAEPGDRPRTVMTYPDLLLSARSVLAGLRRAGCAPGETVILYGLDLPSYFPSLWACLLGGLVPLPLDVGADVTSRLRSADRLTGVSDLLGGPRILSRAQAITGLAGARSLRLLDLDDCRGPADDEPEPPRVAEENEVALLMLSSGSTGVPKLIPLTHGGLNDFAAGNRRMLGWERQESTLNWLPLDLSASLLLYHLLPVFLQMTNVHVRPQHVLARPADWLDLVVRHRAHHTWAPAFGFQLMLAELADGDRRTDWDLSHVRSLVCGGEQITTRLADGVVEALAPYGVAPDCFIPAWGMTETCTGITFGRYGQPGSVHRLRPPVLSGPILPAGPGVPDEECVTFVALGRPAPGAGLRVVDDRNQVLMEGEVGHLQVRSARVTPGYLHNDDANAMAFGGDGHGPDRWLRTGDLAFIVDDQVVMVGRRHDVIVLNGEKHSCLRIEEIVASVAGVLEGAVAACAVRDEDIGSERLAVFFAPVPGDGPPEEIAEEVGRTLMRRLGQMPRHVVPLALADFPRTPGGKLRRSELITRLPTDRNAHAPRPRPGPSTDLHRLLREEISRAGGQVDAHGADDHRPFYAFGLTSVSVVRLHSRLCRTLGDRFPVHVLFEHPSIAELAAHLGGEIGREIGRENRLPGHDPRPGRAGPETPIAVIGVGLRFPGATTPDEFWENLRAGRDCTTGFGDRPRPDASPVVAVGGVLDDVESFDPGFFGMSPQEAALTHPAHRLFLECSYRALESAGYADRRDGIRVAVLAGQGMTLLDYQSPAHGGDVDLADAMGAAIGRQGDFLASRVSYRLGLSGPAIGVQTACSTSLVAVHLAVQALREGEADLALAGAAAIHLPQDAGYVHHPESVLSPSGVCRPFDAAADGTVPGNGVGVVLLKPLDAALADGDAILAVISGTAVNNDGARKAGFTAPSVQGQVDVIRTALRRARSRAEDLSYVEAHGTGTPVGDPIEFSALRQALRPDPRAGRPCVVGSVKSSVGHLDTCSGIAGLIKVVLMLRHRRLVPTRNLRHPNPALGLGALVLADAECDSPWTREDGAPLRAGVNSLGVGGTNAFVVVEEPPARQAPGLPLTEPRPYPVPLSGRTGNSVRQLATELAGWLAEHPDTPVADVLASLAARPGFGVRAAVTGCSATELARNLRESAAAGIRPEPRDGSLAFVFSGQGGARYGMASGLYATLPEFQALLRECDQAYQECAGGGLLDALLDDGATSPLPHALAQPALFAFQAALAGQWRAWGVEPAYVCGHSLGEISALHAAGALTAAQGVRLTARRGELIGSQVSAGGMIAVRGDGAEVERAARAAGLEIGARNGGRDFVLSGPPERLRHAGSLLTEAGLDWRLLETDRAFHSSMLDPMVPAWERVVAQTVFAPLGTPLVSTVDGAILPAGTHLPPGHLAQQVRQAVRFDRAVSSLNASGCGIFLEIGPRDELSALGRRNLAHCAWIPSLERGAPPLGGLASAAAELYRSGCALDWARFAPEGKRIALPPHPFERQNIRYPGSQETVTMQNDVLDGIRSMTAHRLGLSPDEVDADRTFVALGGDSLSLVSLTGQVERRFGVRVALRALFEEADTPRKLAHMVARETRGTDPTPSSLVRERPRPAHAPAPPGDGDSRTSGAGDLYTEQLRLAEKMVDTVTGLMARQLDTLAAAPAPPPPAPPPPAPPPPAPSPQERPPVSVSETWPCDFSLYFFGDYPDQDSAAKYSHILAAAEFADQNGLHTIWIPERHFHSFGGLFPSPSVLAAALAARTTRVRLHAGSVVLPLHNPISVAEEWSMVDNLSQGRAGLCVASGWHANDFALAPENFGDHRDLMYEQLGTVRRLWAGEPIPVTSGTGEAIEITLFPRPVQPRPPLFAAVVGNPASYRRAAENDLGIVTNLMAQSVGQLAANVALYRRTRRERGLDPDAGRVVVLMHTYLGDELDRVRDEAAGPFKAYLRSSLHLLGDLARSIGIDGDVSTVSEDDLTFLLDEAYRRYCADRALVGTVDTCRPIVDTVIAAGADEIACFVDFGLSGDQMSAGLELLPRLRASVPRKARPSPVRDRSAPASPTQRRLWTVERMYPDRRDYWESKGVLLQGKLDVAAFQGALDRAVARHPQLNSVFREADGEIRQVFHAPAALRCPLIDMAGRPADEAFADLAGEVRAAAPDLSTGPLLLARLAHLGEDRHLLFLSAHHIIFDSFSTGVLIRDLAAFYRAWPSPPADLPRLHEQPDPGPAPLDAEASLAFWREELAGCERLSLPADHAAPARSRGFCTTWEFSDGLGGRVAEYAVAGGATPFMVLLSALGAVLGRMSGQADFMLGTAVTQRPAGTENSVGMYVNTVVLRMDLTADPRFDQLVRRVREHTANAYEHQDVPFDDLVAALNPERVAGVNPLFGVMVEYENATGVDFDPPRVNAEVLDLPTDRAPFDLTFYLTGHGEDLRCAVEYDAGLFQEATVLRILDYTEQLLTRALAGPPARLSELTAVTGSDRSLLSARHAPVRSEPPACLHQLVEEQARRTPGAPAIAGDEEEITYRDLDQAANAMAHDLAGRGIGRGDRVAVCVAPGARLVIALLAVLKSGAAYVPLDVSLPASRIELCLADSRAVLLIVDEGTAVTHADLAGDHQLYVAGVADDVPITTDPPSALCRPEDIAYCIYTSGSTGRPKAVLVPHRGPVNLVRWQLRHHQPLRTLQWTSPGFDVSVQEIFATLASGGTLVVVSEGTRRDAEALGAAMNRHGVQRLHLPVTPLKYLAECGLGVPTLREIWVAGEPLTITAELRRFLRAHPGVRLLNQYGPTEASVIVTSHEVTDLDDPRIPIGVPIDNVALHVLDPDGQAVPFGTIGELYIGGLAVASGYLNDADATAACFLSRPGAPEELLYRTGDFVRWRADGSLEFHGRRDEQVKIRGHRVEPAETRWALGQLAEVRDSAVVVRTDAGGEAQLVTYVVLEPGAMDGPAWSTPLRDRLRAMLPSYLVPDRWIRVNELPVNANGKVVLPRLPEPEAGGDGDGGLPATPMQRTLHAMWCEELQVSSIPVTSSFFDAGGNSLKALRVITLLRERFGYQYPLADFMAAPDIRTVADRLDREARGTA
ncbi:non-ribosomal peptide synthetase/type I polyketide synthase [Nonomuraea diastatica]|uniref:Amino acid adenylation domain-containing protein n=1 Tax=Nonomuraea diastatica TaxID=1848329 RepID=A0A4V2YEQ8_9ACTN|nr:non-ribosomal peptide synthetase/type I polyketide synthase [Nonomuraea diastatica]TDD20286.1 amino acid adenylation domain-containing protein [Nonomuraea diastatica]